jgi:hypothetical protein
MGFLTFVIPGTAQLLAGRVGPGLVMLFGAVISGTVTGGLGWLAFGYWSYSEYRKNPGDQTQARQQSAPQQSASSSGYTPGPNITLKADAMGRLKFVGALGVIVVALALGIPISLNLDGCKIELGAWRGCASG